MTTTELPDDLARLVGERVHGLDPAGIVVVLEPGNDEFFAYPKTTTLGRGQELVLTAEILAASVDRKGASIWTLDEYAQRDRWKRGSALRVGRVPRVGEGVRRPHLRARDRQVHEHVGHDRRVRRSRRSGLARRARPPGGHAVSDDAETYWIAGKPKASDKDIDRLAAIANAMRTETPRGDKSSLPASAWSGTAEVERITKKYLGG